MLRGAARQSFAIVILIVFLVGLTQALGHLGWLSDGGKDSDPGAVLSVFEPHAGGCVWSRYDSARDHHAEIARFTTDCLGVQTAWSLDATQALVWFTPENAAPQETMLHLVDVASGRSQRLPIPDLEELGDPETYLMDRDGRILAYTVNQQVLFDSKTESITFQGQAYPLDGRLDATTPETPTQQATPEDGVPALTHTLAWDGLTGAWRVQESAASRCCAEQAPGLKALKSYRENLADAEISARRSSHALTAAGQFSPSPRSEQLSAAISRLPAIGELSDDPDTPWLALSVREWTRKLVFRAVSGQAARATGLILQTDGENLLPLPDLHFAGSDVIQLMVDGAYLLAAEWGSGAHPHLYDMRLGILRYRSAHATGVTFWPRGTNGAAAP